jgi:hypothetical protein
MMKSRASLMRCGLGRFQRGAHRTEAGSFLLEVGARPPTAYLLALALILGVMGSSAVHAASVDSEATAAAQAYWKKVIAVCGGNTYLFDVYDATTGNRVDELTGHVAYRLDEVDPPSTAERLNGLDWRAITSITSNASRERYPDAPGDDGKWDAWSEGGPFYVHIEKSNGHITFNGHDLSTVLAAPSCGDRDALG